MGTRNFQYVTRESKRVEEQSMVAKWQKLRHDKGVDIPLALSASVQFACKIYTCTSTTYLYMSHEAPEKVVSYTHAC